MYFCRTGGAPYFWKQLREILPLLSIYAGLGAVLGHNSPFYLGFKDERESRLHGALAALTNLWITLIALVVFVTIVAVTKYVSVGSIAVVLIFFAGVVFRGQTEATDGVCVPL